MPDTPDQSAALTALAALAAEAKRISALGLLACTGGNLSVRLEPSVIGMSPSGKDKGALVPEDFIRVGMDAKPIPPDTRKPSDETLLHVSLYQATGCGAVCHGHPPHAVAMSLSAGEHIRFHGIEMQKAFYGITSHEQDVLLPVIPNSQDMAELSRLAIAARRSECPAVLVRGHGVYAWGRTVGEAGRHLETVEWLCRVVMLAKGYGG
jgi:methylthioribulose-1-phosphate dehydratase